MIVSFKGNFLYIKFVRLFLGCPFKAWQSEITIKNVTVHVFVLSQ